MIAKNKYPYADLLFLVLFISLNVSCSSSFVNFFKWYERNKANLIEKTVDVDGHTVHYLDGGKGDVILCVHGFGGSMDHWTRFARYLTNEYRVIALDLPGFGESSFFEGKDYSIPKQVQRLHEFTRVLTIKQFHIVGNSMGGYIAGLYAVTYPDNVKSLSLFAAAGVKSLYESQLAADLKTGNNPLIIQKTEDYDELMAFVFYKPIYLPSFAKEYFAQKAVAKKKDYEYIFTQIHDVTLLENKLPFIKVQTLILWGNNDKVLDVSGAYVFNKGISNSQLVIFKNCGHLPMIEKPKESAEVFKKFINGEKIE